VAKVIVVGDGPAGLSAALFTARGGHETVVYGEDKTAMHYADLHNYLGIEQVLGSDFQRAARAQVEAAGATLRDEAVTGIKPHGDGLVVTTASGQERADYVVLAGAKPSRRLAEEAGAEVVDGAGVVDGDQRTSGGRLYAAGRVVRPSRSQAVISAGQGAAAALDILAREAGEDVTDWDTPPEEG